jgi:hypothetical protein
VNNDRILGLTLRGPWAWAITHLDKRIENRTWRPKIDEGQYIAIHAGKGWDAAGTSFIEAECMGGLLEGMVPDRETCPTGIVAIARYGGIVKNVEIDPGPWFIGPWGWILNDVVVLDQPIEHTGHQGLWPIDPLILPKVRNQWKTKIEKMHGCLDFEANKTVR